MMTLAQKIKKAKKKTPYQVLADKYKTSYNYISQIATGMRKPQRGKGLKIKQELEQLVNQNQ